MDYKKIKQRLIAIFCAAAVIFSAVKYLAKPKVKELDEYITIYDTNIKSENNSKENIASEETNDNDKTENSFNNSKNSDESDGLISLNNASLEDLMSLPGIGESKAQKIIEYRNSYGGFVSIDELTEVSGIGDKTLEKLRPYLKL